MNQYYAPDVASTGQLAAELCRGLVARGCQVSVIAALPSYTEDAPDAPICEVDGGVQIYRLSLAGLRGRECLWKRGTGYGLFTARAFRRVRTLVERERPDVVLTFHNPPTVGLIGAMLARRHGIRFVYSPQDVLPDVARAAGWRLPGFLYRAWEEMEHWIRRAASRVVVPSHAMRKVLVDEQGMAPEPVEVVQLWARPEISSDDDGPRLRREFGIGEEELLVLYAGNMGTTQAMEPLLAAVRSLRRDRVRFLFVGGGTGRSRVRHAIETENLGRAHLLPYQSEMRFRRMLAAADVGVVTLKAGMERYGIPSRALTFLSAGLPVVAFMEPQAEIARLVRAARCGWNPHSIQELVATIKRLAEAKEEARSLRGAARGAYVAHFGKERAADEYYRVLFETPGGRFVRLRTAAAPECVADFL